MIAGIGNTLTVAEPDFFGGQTPNGGVIDEIVQTPPSETVVEKGPAPVTLLIEVVLTPLLKLISKLPTKAAEEVIVSGAVAGTQ